MKNTIFLVALLLFACTSDEKALPDRSIPNSNTVDDKSIYSLDVIPKEATRKSSMRLRATGFELSASKIEWLVNGRPFTTFDPLQFNLTDVAKGDTIQAKAILGNKQEVVSNIVPIVNAPPEITRLKLLPEVFRPGDTLSINVEGSDADGDKISFQYLWTKNGESAGTERALGSDQVLKRGDKISVKITPFDGETNGRSASMSREIANFPPIITDHKEFTFDGKVYTYQIRASDPDGDSLTYEASSLENGMTVDPATGLLLWNVPPEFKGTRDVAIVVNDGHGGTASYSVTITIQ